MYLVLLSGPQRHKLVKSSIVASRGTEVRGQWLSDKGTIVGVDQLLEEGAVEGVGQVRIQRCGRGVDMAFLYRMEALFIFGCTNMRALQRCATLDEDACGRARPALCTPSGPNGDQRAAPAHTTGTQRKALTFV
ncbi:hypothetical protein NDU88_004792 [Pleurodeles waltl]|uniref:Uncharacterized protein n=1 Tax=Pleurodeles waltl TaxID=8319 RepID=A0AAV7W8H4_PLEWA|nr:hypothetical protein NDU88_004792 [Pleurodeles waltl]